MTMSSVLVSEGGLMRGEKNDVYDVVNLREPRNIRHWLFLNERWLVIRYGHCCERLHAIE